MTSHRILSTFAITSLGAMTLAGCTPNNPASGFDGSIKVSSTESECKVSATEIKAGNTVFNVTNDGSQVTEFYILAEDGLRIISEVENIGPGITRDLTVTLSEGNYKTACKPGMVGDGIRGDLTVTANPDAQEVSADEQKLREDAQTQYAAYTKDQIDQLVTATESFAEAYKSGDDDAAREQYAPARLHFERVEPVAESFGDLDPALDAREADLEEGQEWTGWHRIEKDLWQPTAEENDGKKYTPLTDAERAEVADKLVEDTKSLQEKSRDLALTVDQIGNGAKGLLDEVAASKVTGEEEIWSHTDLSDFQGNIDGAKVAYDVLKPIAEKKDAELTKDLDKKFADVQQLLDQHSTDGTFVSYEELSEDQVRELSDAIDSLSEPLSKLTGTVVS